MLIKRDHLAKVTSLERERWKRARPEFCRQMGIRFHPPAASLTSPPTPALPAEVALDRIPELRGEVERLPLVAQEDVVTLDTGRSARRPSPREAARRAGPVHRVVDWRLGPAGV